MKRVNFGHKGGFPLEQETLIHLQRAYADDMLGAMLGQWGVNPTQNYLVKEATSPTDDGWIIHRLERKEVNASTGEEFSVTKPELLRLKYNNGKQTRIEIFNSRSTTGNLEYADGENKRVYEDWMGRYTTATTPTANGNTIISNLIVLKSTIALTTDIAENATQIDAIKDDYLPRDGSKPMTGGLVLGQNKSILTSGEEGNRLYFRGTFANTDEVYVSKHTPSSDTTELRFRIGDNAHGGSKDALTVGGATGGTPWKEQFRVQLDGKLGVGVTNPSKVIDVDAKSDFLRFRNLRQVSVNQEKPLVINAQGDLGVAQDSILTPQATESIQGKAKIATQSEVNLGVDDNSFVTPKKLKDRPLPRASVLGEGISRVATTDEIERGSTILDGNLIVSPSRLKLSSYVREVLYGEMVFNELIGSRSVTAIGFSGASRVEGDGRDSFYRINFTKPVPLPYTPIAIMISEGTNDNSYNFENDTFITFRDLNATSMGIIFREINSHGRQSVRVRIQILK